MELQIAGRLRQSRKLMQIFQNNLFLKEIAGF